MIGVLDSGEGGMNAARYLEKRTRESIIFFPDRKNAPYGTKSKAELIKLTAAGIDRLCALGAERVLIACCTASTVYPFLDKRRRKLSFPLLSPTAKAAVEATRNGKIALIATEATVSSHAFLAHVKEAAKKRRPECRLLELEAQPLVGMVENMAKGRKLKDRDLDIIKERLSRAGAFGADTLILGCTHFPSLERIISSYAPTYGIESIVSSVKAGADAFLDRSASQENNNRKTFLSLRG